MSRHTTSGPVPHFAALVALPSLPASAISRKMAGAIAATASRVRLTVPTLFRFVAFLALLGGLVFGGMVALVAFVKPEPREMIEVVPPSRLQPK